MANTTKGSGKTKKKTSASGTAKKKQTQTTARKNNGEKEQYRKTYLRHKEKHSP